MVLPWPLLFGGLPVLDVGHVPRDADADDAHRADRRVGHAGDEAAEAGNSSCPMVSTSVHGWARPQHDPGVRRRRGSRRGSGSQATVWPSPPADALSGPGLRPSSRRARRTRTAGRPRHGPVGDVAFFRSTFHVEHAHRVRHSLIPRSLVGVRGPAPGNDVTAGSQPTGPTRPS